MSRTKEPYGYGFEVGRSVCGVHLKSIKIKADTYEGIHYSTVSFHYIKNNVWVTKFIKFPPPEYYSSVDRYKKDRLDAIEQVENIAACYISGEHLKRITYMNENATVGAYLKDIERALVDKKFWQTPVCLKTLPSSDGGVSIAKYAQFVKPEEGARWNLSYSAWEMKKYIKFKNE